MGTFEVRGDRTWWIDDSGRWVGFDQAYSSRFPNCFVQHQEHRHGPAFDSLGLVRVTSYSRVIDCQWDIRHVAPGALAALLDYLITLEAPSSSRPMVALKFFFGAWNSELFDSPGSAVERIIELNEYASALPDKSITIANVGLGAIDRSHLFIRSAHHKWLTMKGLLADDPQYGLDDLHDISLFLGFDAVDENLVYQSVGLHSMASTILGQNWRFLALGLPSSRCYSDDDYEAEVCSDYLPVIESGEPRLDHIRAYFQLGDDDPMWLNYERLLLPWRKPDGETLIMCCSQRNQNLVVPFLEVAVDSSSS